MALLIDSSVLIGMERRGMRIEEIDSLAPPQTIAISSITASELLVGAHRSTPEGRKLRRAAYVERILDTIPVFPFDLNIARFHARLAANLYSTGRPIGDHDMIIAATAIASGYDLLTDNVREFDRAPGLTVLRPTW